jgi:hypothetical protein
MGENTVLWKRERKKQAGNKASSQRPKQHVNPLSHRPKSKQAPQKIPNRDREVFQKNMKGRINFDRTSRIGNHNGS